MGVATQLFYIGSSIKINKLIIIMKIIIIMIIVLHWISAKDLRLLTRNWSRRRSDSGVNSVDTEMISLLLMMMALQTYEDSLESLKSILAFVVMSNFLALHHTCCPPRWRRKAFPAGKPQWVLYILRWCYRPASLARSGRPAKRQLRLF